MSSLTAPASRVKACLSWLNRESGIASLYDTGRDAWLVTLSRTCRMFAFGAVSLTLASFFAEIGYSDVQIGLFLTLTLVGDVLLGLLVTLVADGLGRRRVLLAGGLLMALSGVVFLIFENYWILLPAAVLGVVSASGGDFGPFRAIEESTLSQITTPESRPDVLAWYVTASGLGSAAGTEFAGRVQEALKSRDRWTSVQTYHATFWTYIVMGALNVAFAWSLSPKCELNSLAEAGSLEADSESAQRILDSPDSDDDGDSDHGLSANTLEASRIQRQTTKSRFSQISPSSRPAMYKLWALLTVDSLADGMVSQTLTAYFLNRKFSLTEADLGDILSTAILLGTIATVLSSPCARHLGLLNTMVFTHLPSSIAVLLFPAPKGLTLTTILLFIRMGLNPMDQAPRSAFIAAIVKPEERTAAMGITSSLRTTATTIGPFLTGGMAEGNKFWLAFVLGGTLRITYDLGLWAVFVNMRKHGGDVGNEDFAPSSLPVDEEAIELRPSKGKQAQMETSRDGIEDLDGTVTGSSSSKQGSETSSRSSAGTEL